MDNQEFKSLRKLLGFTQAELAEELGLHRETVINMEKGTTPIKRPVQISLRTLAARHESRKTEHDILSEPMSEYGTKTKNYSTSQMNLVHQGTNATVSASLELLCEIYSLVSKEPLNSVQARAKKLMRTKAQSVESFLEAVF